MKKKKVSPGWEKTKAVLDATGKIFVKIGKFIFAVRSVLLAAPVVYAALRLAMYAQENLPEQVGINLQSSGEFTQMISRDMAVLGPLGLTVACLLLMFCSRKTVFPWVISIFTLVLPYLIYFSNFFG